MIESRNIIDHYHYWKHDAILADLDKKRHPFAILCSNLYNDFNIAGVVRNANAFMASAVYIYGSKQFDKRGTVGTHKYEKIKRVSGLDSPELRKYTWVAFDNIKGAVPLDTFEWPENPLLCFGQEQVGLPSEIIEQAPHHVYIRQYGSVRSLNVACASAIAMYDWCKKNAV